MYVLKTILNYFVYFYFPKPGFGKNSGSQSRLRSRFKIKCLSLSWMDLTKLFRVSGLPEWQERRSEERIGEDHLHTLIEEIGKAG